MYRWFSGLIFSDFLKSGHWICTPFPIILDHCAVARHNPVTIFLHLICPRTPSLLATCQNKHSYSHHSAFTRDISKYLPRLHYDKSSLIWERFSFWLKCPKMVAKSLLWTLFNKREDAQDSDLAHIFEIWAKVKKHSEIKPPFSIK